MWALRSLLIASLLMLPAGPFEADTFQVTKTADTGGGTCNPQNCSLRAAIAAANGNAGSDEVLVPAGIYLLSQGGLLVSDDLGIAGAGQESAIIDGDASDLVFRIEPGVAVEISGLTIQNGWSYYGGGIWNRGNLALANARVSENYGVGGGGLLNDFGAVAILTNSTVSGNSGRGGGGISNPYPNAALTLISSAVSGNTAKYVGGGIFNAGDLTLTNSTVSGNAVPVRFFEWYIGGGGIYNAYLGTAALTDSTVSGNTANWSGGGIENSGNLSLTNSTVSENTANWGGGGIQNRADLTLTNSAVSGNTVASYWDDHLSRYSGGSGGGIANVAGNLTLTNSTVSGNAVSSDPYWWYGGGGIFNYYRATASLTNSTVSGNTAYGYGGGIHSDWDNTLTLTDSTVSGNTAFRQGGGIENLDSRVTLTNSTVSENTAYAEGGGIGNRGSSLTLTNSTVSGNTAASGGGIYHWGPVTTLASSTVSGNTAYAEGGGISGTGGGVRLADTIVADNGAPAGANCENPVTSLGYNLTDDTSCGLSAAGDLVVADAMLGPLADNGGPTATHALLPGSPAIDAGRFDCPPPGTDQRGAIRPVDGDGDGMAHCDIGAVEYAPEPGRGLLLAVGALCLAGLARRRTC